MCLVSLACSDSAAPSACTVCSIPPPWLCCVLKANITEVIVLLGAGVSSFVSKQAPPAHLSGPAAVMDGILRWGVHSSSCYRIPGMQHAKLRKTLLAARPDDITNACMHMLIQAATMFQACRMPISAQNIVYPACIISAFLFQAVAILQTYTCSMQSCTITYVHRTHHSAYSGPCAWSAYSRRRAQRCASVMASRRRAMACTSTPCQSASDSSAFIVLASGGASARGAAAPAACSNPTGMLSGDRPAPGSRHTNPRCSYQLLHNPCLAVSNPDGLCMQAKSQTSPWQHALRDCRGFASRTFRAQP